MLNVQLTIEQAAIIEKKIDNAIRNIETNVEKFPLDTSHLARLMKLQGIMIQFKAAREHSIAGDINKKLKKRWREELKGTI